VLLPLKTGATRYPAGVAMLGIISVAQGQVVAGVVGDGIHAQYGRPMAFARFDIPRPMWCNAWNMSDPKHSKVLLVGWDSVSRSGVRELLEAHQLPSLTKLVEGGVLGPTVSAGPLAAGIVYNSVATGKYADAHGVLGPQEVSPEGTISLTNSSSRRAKAFWEILSQNDRRCNVVNFPATGPAEPINGTFVSPGFFVKVRESSLSPAEPPAGCANPTDNLEILTDLLVGRDEIDAQTMALFVRGLQHTGPTDNKHLAVINAAITQCLSVHAVATWLMENTQWDVMSVNYPAIEQLWGRFLRYNKPKLDWIDQREFELYQDVCASSVRLCDLLLGRLLQLAGDQTAVLVYSARGYRPHTQLSQELLSSGKTIRASLCSREGIFVMRAPGVGADELIHDARGVDICPTVLHLAGVSPGEDMDGRALAANPDHPGGPLASVASWETIPPLREVAGRPLRWGELRGLASPFALQQAHRVQAENDWRRLQTLLSTSRRDEALGPLLRMYYGNPLQVDKATMVAEALYLAGQLPSALAVMAPMAKAFPNWPIGMLMSGVIALHKGEVYEALDFFEKASRDNPPIPQLYLYLGDVCMRLNLLPRAEEAYRRAIEIDPGFYFAHVGLANVLYRSGNMQDAAEAALQAVGVDFTKPAGHIILGRAVAGLGDMDRASQAFAQALSAAPDNEAIQAHLAAAQAGNTLDPATARPDQLPQQLGKPTEPTEAQRHQAEIAHASIQDGMREVSQWLGEYTEDLAAGDERLDEYLRANAAATGVDFLPPEQLADDEVEWTIRPPLPSDQPVLNQMMPDIFENQASQEVLLIHPAGTDDIQGGITLAGNVRDTTVVKLGLAVRGRTGATDADPDVMRLTTRLLRAAIVRGAAGGARRLVFTLNEEPGHSALRNCLTQLGFEVRLVEVVNTMSMLAFRDRCMKIVQRYQRQQAIPEDVHLVRLHEVPYEKVDQFLRTFFEDGAGLPPEKLDQSISRVMLKGDQVIAAMVGYISDETTFVASRACVHEDHRSQWATPWVHGDACVEAYDKGLTVIRFCTDEVRYPGFVKIARRMGAKEIGRIYVMTMDLAAPWPEAR
jgi:tetratricopeptide (TPR) repeat protein